ncbi:MAG: hypothetical protein KC466_10755 [Myxococcales bacterium]|nr:hypothetical protein [Myxococcales bacterium]
MGAIAICQRIGLVAVLGLVLPACESTLGGTFGGTGSGGTGGQGTELDGFTGASITNNVLVDPFGLAGFRGSDTAAPTNLFVSLNRDDTGASDRARIVSFPVGSSSPTVTTVFANGEPPVVIDAFDVTQLSNPTGIAYNPTTRDLLVADNTPFAQGGRCPGTLERVDADLDFRIAALNVTSATSTLSFDCLTTSAVNNAVVSGPSGPATVSFNPRDFQPEQLAVAGNVLYAVDRGNGVVLRFALTGASVSAAIVAHNLRSPGQLVLTSTTPRTLYVADESLNNIVVVEDPDTLASTQQSVDAGDTANRLIINDPVDGVDPDGPVAIQFLDSGELSLLSMNGRSDFLDLIELRAGTKRGTQLDDLDLTTLSGVASSSLTDVRAAVRVSSGTSIQLYITNRATSGNVVRLSKG